MSEYEIYIKNCDEKITVPKGTTYLELAKKYQPSFQSAIVAVRCGTKLFELFKEVKGCGELEFVDLSSQDGIRIYERGVIFLLAVSINNVLDGRKLKVYHSIASGVYCEIDDYIPTGEDLIKIQAQMVELYKKDIPILKEKLEKTAALKKFEEVELGEKVALLKYRKKHTVNIYSMNDQINYFYGYMVPSSSYLSQFDLRKKGDGFILIIPDQKTGKMPKYQPQPKTARIFLEQKKWAQIMGVKYVGDLNDRIVTGDEKVGELIQLSEGFHEKKIAAIADEIAIRGGVRVLLIAGPSSAGKTTFSKRMSLHLRINGYKPKVLSLDNYFCDREKSPRDEEGNFDFENIDCLQLDLLNDQLNSLLKGNEVALPKYDFKKGKSLISKNKMRLEENDILVIEGIHGLNEQLTKNVPAAYKFKVFVNTLTQLDLDPLNRIHTRDTRILRRIVRDYRYRGTSASETLKLWHNVRRGEYRNIFPFQESADVMFNSALPYEYAVLKMYAEPALQSISPYDEENFPEASRLIRFLDYFLPITQIHEIPGTSILREFIGGSFFKY